jgi:hypothetical protein
VRILTARSLAQDRGRGAVRPGERERRQPVEVEAAVRAAVLAFHDGLFKVFVGEEELEPGGRTRLDSAATGDMSRRPLVSRVPSGKADGPLAIEV